MKNCIDILLSKFGSRKLTTMGLPVSYRNRYNISAFATQLVIDGVMTLDDFANADRDQILYNLGKANQLNLFKELLNTFDKPREVVMPEVHKYGRFVQDYVLNELLTEKDIDVLANQAQNSTWTGDQYVRTLDMLHRNGLMGFDQKLPWRRQINPAQLSYDEVKYYKKFGYVDFSSYGGHDNLRGYEGKNGDKLKYYMDWPGFVETVPAEFLVRTRYTKHGNQTMVEVMAEMGLDAERLQIAKDRYTVEKARLDAAELAEEKKKIEDADRDYASIVNLFAEHGIKVDKPGNERWNGSDRYTVETIVEGVPHTMYIMKRSWHNDTPYKAQVKSEAMDHFEMLTKYKDIVHAEFHRLKAECNCTHLMEGGGMQMQVFFCDKDGYICIMYLGIKGKKASTKWTAHWQRRMNREKDVKDPFSPKTFYSGVGTERTVKKLKKQIIDNEKTN